MSTGPSWKNSGGGPANNRPAASRKTWQPGKTPAGRPTGNPTGRYRRRLVAACVSLALLIGLIIAAIFLLDWTEKPHLVVIAPTALTSTVVPFNPPSGPTELFNEFKAKDSELRPGKDPVPTVSIETWHQQIPDLTTKAPVVLHFAGPGAADKEGPFLWMVPANAAVAESGHKLRISTILNYLKDKLTNHPPVLLILDAATEPAAWARGQLHNDFARQLKKLDPQIKQVPKLVVICSASEDQQSWWSEEWRQTAFNHFLREGLRGVGTVENDRLTAAKLFDKLKGNVGSWAHANRDATQEPFLLPTDAPEAPGQSGPKRAEEFPLIALGNKTVVPARMPAETGYPAPLRQAWDRAHRLMTAVPPPEATAPHLWHQYLDLLLLTERAARLTGDADPTALSRLTELETALLRRPWPAGLPCLPFALPAGPALGEPRVEIPGDEFRNQFWAVNPPARPAAWASVSKRNGEDPGKTEARLAGADALLRLIDTDRAGPDPANLEKAAELLKLIDTEKTRPVESHLLRLFHLHLDKTRNPELVRLALRVQVAAERAAWFSGTGAGHPYAEQVAQWFGPALQKADERRRVLVDLVFASKTDVEPGAPTKLADALEENRKVFADLSASAAELGKAYRLRDEVLSRLPSYARWAAARRVPAAEAEIELAAIEEIGRQVHTLARALDVDETKTDDPGIRKVIQDAVSALERGDATGYRGLVARFDALCGSLPDDAVPSNWHEIDAALRVPFIPLTVRDRLLEKSRLVSRRLEEKPPTSAQSTKFDAKQMAQRQGRMALAVLGDAGLKVRPSALNVSEADIRKRVKEPDLGAWWESLTEAGEEIGAAFTAIPKQAAAGAKKGSQGDDPKAAAGEVRKAATLARLTDGATELGDPNPVTVERRYWTHELLVKQALRSAADGWARLEDSPAEWYALDAARAYLRSADAVLFAETTLGAVAQEKWRTALLPKESSLTVPTFDLATLGTPGNRFTVTDRATEDLAYQVTPGNGAVGYPVLRIAAVTDPLTSKDTGTYAPILGFAGAAKPKTTPADGTLTLGVTNASSGRQGKLVLELLFRGKKRVKPIDAEYAGITYEWIYNPPPAGETATFAIRADDALAKGSVVFLIDVSGSMDYGMAGHGTNTPKRYLEAVEAIRQVLLQLPKGTTVSAYYFAGAEDRVVPAKGPTVWRNPADDTKELTDILLGREKRRELNGEKMPIGRYIADALRDPTIVAPDLPGHLSVIAITDGGDYSAAGGSEQGGGVVAALKEAQKTRDVALHLMRFGVEPADLRKFEGQFRMIEAPQQYKPKRTPPVIWPRGRGDEAEAQFKGADQLAAALLESMIPRFQVLAGSALHGSLPVSFPEKTRRWEWLKPPLKPSHDHVYHVPVGADLQRIQVDPADRLLLKVVSTGNKLGLTLPSYADVQPGLSALPRVSAGPDERPIVMTVPASYLVPNGSTYDLVLKTTLEQPQPKVAADGSLYRRRPRFVWFEATPRDAKGDPREMYTKVEYLPRLWAPAWKVRVGPWVSSTGAVANVDAARPQVNGYWLDEEFTQTKSVAVPKLEARPTVKALDPKDQEFAIGDTSVTITDLTAEGSTLTVELKHAPGKPVVVRVDGQKWVVGEHHWYFGKADKYRVQFTGLNPKSPVALQVYPREWVIQRSTKLTVNLDARPDNQDHRDMLLEDKKASQ